MHVYTLQICTYKDILYIHITIIIYMAYTRMMSRPLHYQDPERQLCRRILHSQYNCAPSTVS